MGLRAGYSYAVVPGRENFPVSSVSWGDAARFCNWLANGQPGGAEGPSTTETGSYTLNGAMTDPALTMAARNLGATYVLPTNDEVYKAAYYKDGSANAGYWLYPTRSNQTPANVLTSTGTNNANYAIYYNGSPYLYTDPANYLTLVGAFAGSPASYGTFDMGGDVWQWTEGRQANGAQRGLAGGSFVDEGYLMQGPLSPCDLQPTADNSVNIGFRVALVPEPISLLLLAVVGAGLLNRSRSTNK